MIFHHIVARLHRYQLIREVRKLVISPTSFEDIWLRNWFLDWIVDELSKGRCVICSYTSWANTKGAGLSNCKHDCPEGNGIVPGKLPSATVSSG